MNQTKQEFKDEVIDIFANNKVGIGSYWRSNGAPCCIIGHLMHKKGFSADREPDGGVSIAQSAPITRLAPLVKDRLLWAIINANDSRGDNDDRLGFVLEAIDQEWDA